VCLSATHIAYGSIRMEPVFMILGQSAATAASLAIDAGVSAQRVDYATLKEQLLKDGQILAWTGPARKEISPPPKLDGIVLDDSDAKKVGEWTPGTVSGSQRVGEGYIHDNNQNKGRLQVVWTPDIPVAGKYEIIFHFPPNPNRAKNVHVMISDGSGENTHVFVNEQAESGRQSLGQFQLHAGRQTSIVVSNVDSDGYVVVDGVQLLKVEQ
jgi:hypothetical protein